MWGASHFSGPIASKASETVQGFDVYFWRNVEGQVYCVLFFRLPEGSRALVFTGTVEELRRQGIEFDRALSHGVEQLKV